MGARQAGPSDDRCRLLTLWYGTALQYTSNCRKTGMQPMPRADRATAGGHVKVRHCCLYAVTHQFQINMAALRSSQDHYGKSSVQAPRFDRLAFMLAKCLEGGAVQTGKAYAGDAGSVTPRHVLPLLAGVPQADSGGPSSAPC